MKYLSFYFSNKWVSYTEATYQSVPLSLEVLATLVNLAVRGFLSAHLILAALGSRPLPGHLELHWSPSLLEAPSHHPAQTTPGHLKALSLRVLLADQARPQIHPVQILQIFLWPQVDQKILAHPEMTYETHHEKTCLLDLRPGKTQTGLRSHRS